jgi:hypothetical protein
MNELLKAALDLQTFLDSRGWPFCIIGGIALIRWGTPRFTRNVDIALLTGFGREDEFTIPLLTSGYTGRVADAAGFARRNRVLLVKAPNGISVDISLAALPFEEQAIRRASLFTFVEGCSLRTCSAEDLMVLKLFAFRPQDLADVQSVTDLHGASLNWDYIEENLSPLAEAKDELRIMRELARLRSAREGL